MTESKKSKGLYWIIGILIFGFIFYLGGIYYSFYKDVKEVKDSILRHTFENGPLSHPIANNDYVATWGAFGDFIGGTLNPILTFFSICLILLTVYQNKKALDFNSEELALSRKAQQDSAKSQQLIQKTQNLQQFDSLFFSLLNQFKHQQDVLCSLNEESKSKVDKIYRSIFVEDYKAELEEKRHNLLQYQELYQSFICLFQLFKLINTKINRSSNETEKIEEWGDYILEKQYTNILRSIIPPKLQQLLFLNAYTEFDEYRWYLSYYSFLEHMPFKKLERGDELCIDLLVITKFYKLDSGLLNGEFQVFGKSIYFDALLNRSCYLDFIESDELFFGSWEFIENKFLNFNEIVCFFNPVELSDLSSMDCYEYIFISKTKADELTVDLKHIYRNDLSENKNVGGYKTCKVKYIRFQNYGFSLYIDSNLSLHFYGLEDVFISKESRVRRDGKYEPKIEMSEFVKIA
ncbi:hypothetical protein F4T82_11045 [Acinetobacter lwoffii]|uniref:putative phage abortive infection protein n=1 Tax=Acinetobacter lwoffii TaxID=28090 RepID=UPI0012986004|nr:putative phage abortive infection protein [Acinetobacter lwoffii]MRA04260.1 hypothetical protein [Acinetobacter lwoffii]